MLAIPSSSRSAPRPIGVDVKDNILQNLLHDVRTRYQGAELSPEVLAVLEALPFEERRDIVNTRDDKECSALFHACRMGNVSVAKYLVETCGADMEQKGQMDLFSEDRPHEATPLWAASVYGGLHIVEYLLSQGADVNTTSNSRSTPVRSACFMSNVAVVHLLVEAGADIFITNQCGGSCLTNAVQSTELCQFLLDRGADVNAQDIQGNTPLHYAVMERRLETTELLVRHGADILRRNVEGQSPLQLSATKGAIQLYETMTQTVPISFPEESDMLELIGFHLLPDNQAGAVAYWIKAAELREREGFQKPGLGYWPRYASQICATTGTLIRQIQEFTTRPAWESIAENRVMLNIQGLLIAERILGNFHPDFLKRLQKLGDSYDSQNPNFYAFHASKAYGFQMQFLSNRNGILFADTGAALERLMGVYKRWRTHELKMMAEGFDSIPISFELLMETFNFLIEELPDVTRQMSVRPHFPKQRVDYDTYILACSQLLSLLLSAPRKREELGQVSIATRVLVAYARPLYSTGDTLLHLAVRRFSDYMGRDTGPQSEHVEILLHHRADVNALNGFKESPLHILLKDPKYNHERVAEMLVNAGAHLDQLDSSNFLPLEALMEKPFPGFSTSRPITLQCIAAKAIGTLGIPYGTAGLPQDLVECVTNHAKLHTSTPPVVNLYPARYNYYY